MLATDLIKFIDLTRLNDDDTWSKIQQLYQQSSTPHGRVAALCIWPQFVAPLCELRQSDPVSIATVINFPTGQNSLDACSFETEKAIADGADEIDLVLPYSDILKGDLSRAVDIVICGKEACQDKAKLKVIIESGALQSERNIKIASEISIENGADFIKTSTGKIAINATIDAAQFMLETIKISGQDVGFKASGGISNFQQAIAYVELATKIMGKQWLTPDHFRFGASSLLNNLLTHNKGSASSSEGTY